MDFHLQERSLGADLEQFPAVLQLLIDALTSGALQVSFDQVESHAELDDHLFDADVWYDALDEVRRILSAHIAGV